MLQAAIDHSQAKVTGRVTHQALQGQCHGHRPREPLLALRPGAGDLRGGQDRLRPHRDAAGFIKLNALRLRVAAKRDQRG